MTTPVIVSQWVVCYAPQSHATSPSHTPTNSMSPANSVPRNGHQLPQLRGPICLRTVGLHPSIHAHHHFLRNHHPGPGTGPACLADNPLFPWHISSMAHLPKPHSPVFACTSYLAGGRFQPLNQHVPSSQWIPHGLTLCRLLSGHSVSIFKGVLATPNKRMGVLNELLGAIKFINFFAWGDRL